LAQEHRPRTSTHSFITQATIILVSPRNLREKELADNFQAGRQVAPLLLLLLIVIAAGGFGLMFLVLKVRRRRAEMRKIAEE
jgi:hypothetical protein